MNYTVEIRKCEFDGLEVVTTVTKNRKIDEDLCKYYADPPDETRPYKRGKCKHCYGKGILIFDDPSRVTVSKVACYCVQNKLERLARQGKMNLDEIILG